MATCTCIMYIPSLVPRHSTSSALLTFELARNQKSGGGSGEFYHVSDVTGRENLIARGRTQPQRVNRPRLFLCARMALGANSYLAVAS